MQAVQQIRPADQIARAVADSRARMIQLIGRSLDPNAAALSYIVGFLGHCESESDRHIVAIAKTALAATGSEAA